VSTFLLPSEGKYPVFLRVLGFQARKKSSFEPRLSRFFERLFRPLIRGTGTTGNRSGEYEFDNIREVSGKAG